MLLHGTSSWSEKSWKGVFYPPGMPAGEYLTHYASVFPAVEVDATYYAIPAPSVVEGWDRKTPKGFKLCAKFPRSIVHGGDGARPDAARVLAPAAVGDEVRQFLDVMALLGDKLGPLVVQLPFFNRDAFPTAKPFLDRLDEFLGTLPREFRYAVEVRNKFWLGKPLVEVLRKHRAALVLADLAYMPHPADVIRRLDVVTADFAYARLIGDRKAVDDLTETFDRVVLDQSERLERWAGVLRALLPQVREVYVFANNHYAGHGPATIRDLVARTGG